MCAPYPYSFLVKLFIRRSPMQTLWFWLAHRSLSNHRAGLTAVILKGWERRKHQLISLRCAFHSGVVHVADRKQYISVQQLTHPLATPNRLLSAQRS